MSYSFRDLMKDCHKLEKIPEEGHVELPNSCMLYWKTDKLVNCRIYSSDEIGGGVEVWNTALVSSDTLLAAILEETGLRKLEDFIERRKKNVK